MRDSERDCKDLESNFTKSLRCTGCIGGNYPHIASRIDTANTTPHKCGRQPLPKRYKVHTAKVIDLKHEVRE